MSSPPTLTTAASDNGELQEIMVVPRNVHFTESWYNEMDARCAALTHSLPQDMKQYRTILADRKLLRSDSSRQERRQRHASLRNLRIVERRLDIVQRIRRWVQEIYCSDEDRFGRASSIRAILDVYELERGNGCTQPSGGVTLTPLIDKRTSMTDSQTRCEFNTTGP